MTTSRTVPLISASLVGWNLALIVFFLLVIIIGVTVRTLQGSLGTTGFIAVAVVSLGIGVLLGFMTSKKLLPWFRRQEAPWKYVWLGLLVVLTVVSFPGPFMMVLSG